MVIQQGGFMPDDPEIAMLKNVVAGQRVAWRDKGEAERKAAAVAVEMRDSLDALLDIFHDRGKLRTFSILASMGSFCHDAPGAS
jgi:hypothetical protein